MTAGTPMQFRDPANVRFLDTISVKINVFEAYQLARGEGGTEDYPTSPTGLMFYDQRAGSVTFEKSPKKGPKNAQTHVTVRF
jgi:hypothetical protein